MRVLRAAEGFNNLGVPMGKDAWVQAELVRMVRGQDARLKLIVALARHVGPEATSCGRSIGLQSARLMLQYSANSRNVHRRSERGGGLLCAGGGWWLSGILPRHLFRALVFGLGSVCLSV